MGRDHCCMVVPMTNITEILTLNKHLFSHQHYRLLMLIAENPNSYRRDLEALDPELHYLPALNQKVSERLAVIGLEIDARSALDGTHRKLYSLREIRPDHAKSVRAACDAFGYSVYGSGVHE